MPLAPAIPVLRIFSVDKAKEFYLEFMGFQLDWEHRFSPDLPLYAQIHRDGLILHLSEHHGDACPGSTVFARTEDLLALQRELLDKQYGYADLRPNVSTGACRCRSATRSAICCASASRLMMRMPSESHEQARPGTPGARAGRLPDRCLRNCKGRDRRFHLADPSAGPADFPASLRITWVFEREADKAAALAGEAKARMLALTDQALDTAGVKLDHVAWHVRFDSEEACSRSHAGDWNRRLR